MAPPREYTERSLRGGDAALPQITVATSYQIVYFVRQQKMLDENTRLNTYRQIVGSSQCGLLLQMLHVPWSVCLVCACILGSLDW